MDNVVPAAPRRPGLQPWLQFYATDGHGYAAQPGQDPAPLVDGAPPFSLHHTTNP